MSFLGKFGAGIILRLLGFSIPVIIIILIIWALLD
jgi:hypothetical protein